MAQAGPSQAAAPTLNFAVERFEYISSDADNGLLRLTGQWGDEPGAEEPSLAVHVAARLNELQLANAVLVLPRWPYRQAVLPADGLLHSLMPQAGRLLAHGPLANVAFVLDAERSRPIPRRARSDPRADNRYKLAVADLPNLATLRARGICRVVKLSQM